MIKKVLFKKVFFISALITLPYHAFAIESAFEYECVQSGQAVVKLAQPLSIIPYINSSGIVVTEILELDAIFGIIKATSMTQAAPKFQPQIYLITFDRSHTVEEAITILKECSVLSYAAPAVLMPYYELQYSANDLMLPSQWHLEPISSLQGWGIFLGDTAVQVAIVDGGVTYTHPDLAPNVWVNPGEDLNGNGIIELFEWDNQDNDGNSYIDDFWGWDWINLDPSQVWPGEDPGPPDNDPSDFDGHGTHCAGDACATANNEIGVASPGFKSEIMCLRAGYLSNAGQGYVDLYCAMQAVYYAIDMSAEVISMSFGGGGSPYYFREALETASDSGLVLVAAAGNESTSQISYPAGYDFVIAVAATGPGDTLADFTNYGDWITVCAPGVNIYSTLMEGYGNMSGTSMSTPVTAGVCALVKALKPEWNSVQVGDWLSLTADNIDAQNPGYIGMMGGGRINMAKAVDIFVSVDSVWTGNPEGNRLYYGVEDELYVQYHKFWGNAYNVNLEVGSENPRVTFSQANFYIGNILEGETGDNTQNPFLMTVQYGGWDYEVVEIEARFTGQDFDFTQILQIQVGRGEVLIIDADQNNAQRTSSYYEEAMDNLGLSHETAKIAETGNLGNEITNYDAVIVFSGTAQNNILTNDDWNALQNYYESGGKIIISGQNIAEDLAATIPNVLSDFLNVDFVDDNSNDLTINGTPGNPNTQEMYLVMAGSGGAWNQNSLDVIEALPGAESCFIYNTNNLQRMAGVRIADGSGNMFFCAFGIEGINDATTSGNTKLEVLAMMFEQFGMTGVKDDNYSPLPDSPQILSLYPNPFNSTLRIIYQLPSPGNVEIEIFDVLGREVSSQRIENSYAGINEWKWFAGETISSGIYFIKLEIGEKNIQKKVILLK